MQDSNQTEPNSNSEQPYRVFISHKVREHSLVAKGIARELKLVGGNKLEVYVSEDMTAGIDWVEKIHKELKESNVLVLLYCFNIKPKDLEWCLYEAGYFASDAVEKDKKLICLLNPNEIRPSPLERFQPVFANEDGIKQLLKSILNDEKQPVREELFKDEFKDNLDSIVKKILELLDSQSKKIPLTAHACLTIPAGKIGELAQGDIPLDSCITGETDALNQLGIGEKDGIDLEKLLKIAEYKRGLKYFLPILGNVLSEIMSGKRGPWTIPPIRITKEGIAKTMVPSYLEQSINGDLSLNFVVSQPHPNFRINDADHFTRVYHMFIVAWHFRWRVIDKHLETLNNFKSGKVDKAEIAEEFTKLMLDFDAVILDSLNRNLEFPSHVVEVFDNQNDAKVIKKIVDSDEGLWAELQPSFEDAISKQDINATIDILKKIRDLNKTVLFLSLKRLSELANKMDGEIISVEN